MFSNLYPPVVSGSSTQSSILARELVQCGHQVCMITARVQDDLPQYEVVEGVHIYRLPALRLPKMGIALNFPWLSITFTPGNQRRIREIIEQHQPDILHLHNHMFDLGFSAVRMRSRFKKPLLTTIHTMIKHTNPFYNIFLSAIDHVFLKKLIIQKTDVVIYPDMNMRTYGLAAFGQSENVVLPYGLDLPDMPEEADVEELRTQYNLHGKKVILSLGHVHEIRHRKDLVEAMPSILKEFPNTILLIVGTVGTDIPVNTAKALGIEDHVIFTGAVPHSHVSALLALADVEGHWIYQDAVERTSLGVATLEAMAFGKATLVAANENTHGPGVIKNGENIILVERNNPEHIAKSIIGLLSNEAQRQRIGENARRTLEKYFSWEAVCAQTLEAYQKAAAVRKIR